MKVEIIDKRRSLACLSNIHLLNLINNQRFAHLGLPPKGVIIVHLIESVL